MKDLTKRQKRQIQEWLTSAFLSSIKFNGSESSEDDLITHLSLFDEFARSHKDEGKTPGEMETLIAKMAFPEIPKDMPLTIDSFLDEAGKFYDRLIDTKKSQTTPDITAILENAGAVVKKSTRVFVKTDEGQALSAPSSGSSKPYKIKTEARLAILLAHLRNDGVNGNPIYMDDLVITQGGVNDKMMRQHPYYIIQIPSINMEIALCEQIGETTFVKKGTISEDFWDHMSKDELKARADIIDVTRNNDQQWWQEISDFLSGQAQPTKKKVNVQSWSNKAPNLDIDLIKKSILAHYLATEEWLTSGKKQTNGKKGSYILEHGPYAEQITIGALEALLRRGGRNLPKGSSLAKLKEEIAKEHGLDYHNPLDQENLNIEKVKESILTHYLATEEWLTAGKENKNNRKGGYILEHGPYAGKTICSIELAIRKMGTSLAPLKEEIAKELKLDYHNHLDQEDLTIEKIKECILAHYLATGKWLSGSKKGGDKKKGSYVLEHGYYAGQITVGAIKQALGRGGRGLPKESPSFPTLIKEVKADVETADLNCTVDSLSYIPTTETPETEIPAPA